MKLTIMSIGVLINHSISYLSSPLTVSLVMLAVGAIAVWKGRHWSKILIGIGVVILYVLSTRFVYGILGTHLELMYPPQTVESVPSADAILVLGGSVGKSARLVYPEGAFSADRVMHTFRLYKAQKARRIFVTSEADRDYLIELGVATADIQPPSHAANTEAEIKYIAKVLRGDSGLTNSSTNSYPKILLVTSAYHMRRAMLMCERYAGEVNVIPVGADYEALLHIDGNFHFDSLRPDVEFLFRTSYMVKEYIGYYGYKFLRR